MDKNVSSLSALETQSINSPNDFYDGNDGKKYAKRGRWHRRKESAAINYMCYIFFL